MVQNASRAAFPGAFFVLNVLLLLAVGAYIGRDTLLPPDHPGAAVFLLVALAGYAALYLLPAWLLSAACHRWLSPVAARGLAVALASATLLLLLVDSQIHGLYGFHINGFVWNLLVTPGGIDSMGGGDGTLITVAAVALMVVGLEAGLMALIVRRPGRRRWRWLVAALLLCMVGERVAYGLSDLSGYRPVLNAARAVPFYQPATFEGLARDLGYTPPSREQWSVSADGPLHYPLHPLRAEAGAPSPNVLFLVSESLRADMLTPEIMPNLWRFAQRHGRRYTDHMSGGNGTRMGIFSLFYGLPGNYWFPFRESRRPPVLVSELLRRDYRPGLFTSARFSYPEFDQTVFATVPSSAMVSDDEGPGWRRDRRNVDRLLDFIGADRERPFFGFMFFESPHARYYFPEESVIRPDYLRELNYATMDVHRDMPGIFNRYINSVHHLDQQLGRVLDRLERDGRLDDTLVVITGDHGEEFMEHGRWGHNSEFHDEQVRVPLVLAGPGVPGGVVTAPTSHLDVAPTLLGLLGVSNPPADYAVGQPLDRVTAGRYRLAASWDAVAYLGPRYKVAMPMNAGGLGEMAVARAGDGPAADREAVMVRVRDRLVAVLRDMSRFYRH
ncbi:MAG: hypothetical protein CL543_14590 [Alcanivorax sp.]|nr:hypothetical protein [Alcanivorax sp.]